MDLPAPKQNEQRRAVTALLKQLELTEEEKKSTNPKIPPDLCYKIPGERLTFASLEAKDLTPTEEVIRNTGL